MNQCGKFFHDCFGIGEHTFAHYWKERLILPFASQFFFVCLLSKARMRYAVVDMQPHLSVKSSASSANIRTSINYAVSRPCQTSQLLQATSHRNVANACVKDLSHKAFIHDVTVRLLVMSAACRFYAKQKMKQSAEMS